MDDQDLFKSLKQYDFLTIIFAIVLLGVLIFLYFYLDAFVNNIVAKFVQGLIMNLIPMLITFLIFYFLFRNVEELKVKIEHTATTKRSFFIIVNMIKNFIIYFFKIFIGIYV